MAAGACVCWVFGGFEALFTKVSKMEITVKCRLALAVTGFESFWQKVQNLVPAWLEFLPTS